MTSQYINAENTQTETSKEVLHRHLNSFRENDLEALIADYTNDSILITQDKSYKGLAEIKDYFTGLISHFPYHDSNFELDKTVIKDDLIYIVWHGKTPSLEVLFATDTFIIKNGKIHQQTFAGQQKFIGHS